MPTNYQDIIDLLALSLVPGLGPRLTKALIDHFGSPGAVRQASVDELIQVPLIGKKSAAGFFSALRTADPQAELERAAQFNVNITARGQADYPRAFAELEAMPPLVYYRGNILPTDAVAVGIVGSRNCSSYGQKQTRLIATGLARAGYCVISGLALGIDGHAHRGALEANGRTIAVLAGGLSEIYPPDHVELSQDVERQGALLTETPMMMAPQRGMFHARNRLISGLSMAVVVIEANDRSGALITARHALDQGKDVYVIPGNVDSPHSAGSNKLLRTGAKMIRHIDDLLEDLRGLKTQPTIFDHLPIGKNAPEPEKATIPKPNLDPAQQQLWDFLSQARHTDELSTQLPFSAAELNKLLLLMEMKKVIKRLPGNIYERV